MDRPVPRYSRSIEQAVKPLTIGMPKEYFGDALDIEVEAAVRSAIQMYEDAGARIEEVSLPHSPFALAFSPHQAEVEAQLHRLEAIRVSERDILDGAALAAAELPEPEEGTAPPGAYTCC